MDGKKIDFLDPLTIMFFIAAWISDLAFLGMIGLAIPVVGLAVAAAILLVHYVCGLFLLVVFWGKTSGWMPKLILLLAWIIPMPLLGAGIMWAIITSNKIVALIVETVAIQAIAIATGGAGEALEVGAVAAEGAEVAATAAEGVETAAEVAEAGETAAQGAEAGEAAVQGAETAGSSAESIDEMAAREEGSPMENLQEELEEPQADQEPNTSAKDRVKKVFDIADRTNSQHDEDEEDEDQQRAA